MGLIAPAVVPLRFSVAIGCVTTFFQLYTFPILGIYLSIALLAWLAVWRAPFSSGLWRWPWMKALGLFTAVRLLSIAWSPNKVLGVRFVIYSLHMLLAA